ncbi:hypothetical protein BT63DRAFT_460584 [Microthyrium microscopicum]|uniref:Uncharacterized protein n=1 Tax=Microthyrium microscopicum TaxID=703497 RepID=A0A6A6TZI5_9PEZI|nr:hypothetical protein BT63DRAFT_460584 [Microthyrium microscopicum]
MNPQLSIFGSPLDSDLPTEASYAMQLSMSAIPARVEDQTEDARRTAPGVGNAHDLEGVGVSMAYDAQSDTNLLLSYQHGGEGNISLNKNPHQDQAADAVSIDSAQNQQDGNFGFMTLPPELRIMVYKYCLEAENGAAISVLPPAPTLRGPVVVNSVSGPYTDHTAAPKYKITSEAALFLYQKSFKFKTLLGAQMFLADIAATNCGLIRKISFDLEEDLLRHGTRQGVYMTFYLLRSCVQLQQLVWSGTLPVEYANQLAFDGVAVDLSKLAEIIWQDCGYWFRAIACAKRNIFAGIKVLTIQPESYKDLCNTHCARLHHFDSPHRPAFYDNFEEHCAAMKETFKSAMEVLLRKEMQHYLADEEGNFCSATVR